MAVKIKDIALCSLLAAAVITGRVSHAKGRSMVHEVNVNGIERSYNVYIPAASEGKRLPLMIVLHGGMGNAEHIEQSSGMDEVADSGPFLVAYPEGTEGRFRAMKNRRTWNAGACCGPAVNQRADDVLFIKKVIEDMSARYGIDTKRVYVTGISNGAMMAYRLACEIPGQIAAVIAVSGTLAVDNCDAAKDVPVLHIHGDQDKNVPLGGGRGESSMAGVEHRSVPDTIKLLVRSRGCAAPQMKSINNDIEVSSYQCSGGAPVELYVLKGGVHAWPGGNGRSDLPPVDRSLSASKLAWDFAKQFHKP